MPRKRTNGQGGLIQYKNSAIWYGQYYRDGKQYRKSTGTPIKAEAEGILRGWMTDSDRGLKPASEAKNVTYEHIREALINSYRNKGFKSLQVRGDGSEYIFPLPPLDEFFKDKRASDIDSDLIAAFIQKRKQDGVGNAAINNSLSLLRRMFTIAHQQKKIQVVPYIELLKKPPARKGFLEPKSFQKLFDNIAIEYKPLLVFLYYCGVRIGEAKQVQWSSVNLDKALIVLQEGETKNNDARTIPLPDCLVKMLRDVTEKKGPVFKVNRALRDEWERATVAAGCKGLMIHDLRRSAVRNMMLAGAQQAEAMKISGHNDPAVFQRYNIVVTEQITKVMKSVQATVPIKIVRKTLPARKSRLDFGETSATASP